MKTKPAAMLWELIGRLANTNLTIRISGEYGVGKEAIARLLHNHYPRKIGAFKKFNCRDMGIVSHHHATQDLCAKTIEELDRVMASGQNNVLYLENIESLPVKLQTRLHRALNRKHPKSPLWVFASSIEPLERYRQNNSIDKRLLDDLNIIHIALPPLRTRPDRIPQILSWILSQAEPDDGSAIMAMPDLKSMQRLVNYNWPGNWRQLQQVALEAVRSNEWGRTVACMEDIHVDSNAIINELAAIHILSGAKLIIQKERIMDALMASSSIEEVGLLDLAIFNEAVAQIADNLSTTDVEGE